MSSAMLLYTYLLLQRHYRYEARHTRINWKEPQAIYYQDSNSLNLQLLRNSSGMANRNNGLDRSAVTSSLETPVQTSIVGPPLFSTKNFQLGYFLQYRNHCVSLRFFDDSVL